MTKGQFLGSNVKETACPKCSEKGRENVAVEDIVPITRTFVRNKKGVWQCTKCNYKLGRDKKVYPFRIPNMAMNIESKQQGWDDAISKSEQVVIPSVFA